MHPAIIKLLFLTSSETVSPVVLFIAGLISYSMPLPFFVEERNVAVDSPET